MNLPIMRSRHPLAFVALATVVAVACFIVIPATTLELVFAQTAAAGICMLALLAAAEPDVLARRFRHDSRQNASIARLKRRSLAFTATILLANALVVGVVSALSILGAIPSEHAQTAGSPHASAASAVLFLGICAATGVFEEGLFRGIVSRGFSDALRSDGRKRPALVGALASAVVFGVLHTADAPLIDFSGGVAAAQLAVKTLQAILFGFVLSAALSRLGSLWPVAALHTGFNVLSMGPSFVLTGKLPTTYATGDPTDLAVLLASVVMLVPLAVHAWRILEHAAPPAPREGACIL